MNEAQLEQQIQDKGLTAPRITPSDLDAAIDSVDVVKHITPSGSVLRWAVLNLKNGFSVTGKPSAAVSAANDNEEIGRQVAIDNARSELWAYLGYLLKERLYQEALSHTATIPE
jgi:hypothetical protein